MQGHNLSCLLVLTPHLSLAATSIRSLALLKSSWQSTELICPQSPYTYTGSDARADSAISSSPPLPSWAQPITEA